MKLFVFCRARKLLLSVFAATPAASKGFIHDIYLVVPHFYMYVLEYALSFRYGMMTNMNKVHKIM